MKSLFLIFGILTALFLKAGVAAIEEDANKFDNIKQNYVESTLPYVYEIDDGPIMYPAQVKEQMSGALIAEELDRRGFRSEAICYSQNQEGQIFRAFGNQAHRTQNRAMHTCFQYRSACEPLGCISE